MRILIADEAVAASKALRSFFRNAVGRSGSAKKTSGAARGSGQLTISLPATQRGGRGAKKSEMLCSNLELGDQPELAATILDALGMALLNLGCIDQGGPLIELARELRRRFFGPDHPAMAASQNSYARLQRERGDYAAAETAARDALRINRAVFGDNGSPVATSLNELGVTQLQQGRYALAESAAIEGLNILKVLGPKTIDPNITRLMDLRGRAETELGKLPAASATYAQLLPLTQKELGTKNHPKYAAQLSNSGLVHEAQRDLKAAEGAYRESIRRYENSLNGFSAPNLADVYANLGSLLREPRRKRKDLEEAGKLFEKALRTNQRIHGEAHALVANDHANLGRWQYDTDDSKGAAANFSEAVRIYQHNVKVGRIAADYVYLAEASTWYGRVLVESGSRSAAKKATPLLESAVINWPQQAGTGAVGEAVAKACLGRALHLQDKDPQRVQALLKAAYPVVLADIGPDHPLTQRVAAWLKDAGCAPGNVLTPLPSKSFGSR